VIPPRYDGNREQRIAKAKQAVAKIASSVNQRFLKTHEQIEAALKKAAKGAGGVPRGDAP
jgi:hypothetical protein